MGKTKIQHQTTEYTEQLIEIKRQKHLFLRELLFESVFVFLILVFLEHGGLNSEVSVVNHGKI